MPPLNFAGGDLEGAGRMLSDPLAERGSGRGGAGGGGRRRQSAVGLPGLGGLGERLGDVLPALDRLATSLIGDNPALTEGFTCDPRPSAWAGAFRAWEAHVVRNST